MKYIAVVSFILTLLFITTPKFVSAASLFTSSHAVSYVVTDDGLTNVTQTITLTNKAAHVYATSYALTLTMSDVQNLQAALGGQQLPVRVLPHDEVVDVYIEFPQSIVGFGKEQQFVLTYQTHSIATRNGRIWEVTIPGIVKADDITAYTVTLTTPESFGKATYMKPPARNGIWTLSDVARGGIMAAYGDHQHAQFTLYYTLTNPQSNEVITAITLPPTTGQQVVAIDRIAPQPTNVTVDPDGNWLAHYTLQPNESLDITVAGEVGIFADSFPVSPTVLPLSEKQQQVLLQPQPFWQIDAGTIQSKNLRLKTPRDIYDFVVGNLVYNYDRQPQQIIRRGAQETLLSPKDALCMEFADVFVGLARANSIAARMVQGYAYTTNSRLQPLSLQTDVLHAWAQYYDEGKKLWVDVDPTWGKTTGGIDYFSRMDFNHITFAILGTDSSVPVPAGSFRKKDRNKDIAITFLQEPFILRQPEIEVTFGELKNTNDGFEALVTVRNVSKVLFNAKQVSTTVDTGEVTALLPTSISIAPVGFMEIPLTIKSSKKTTQPIVTLQLDDTKFTSKNSSSSISPQFIWPLRFFIAGIVMFGIFAYIYARRR